jgi:hypothetical protein
MTAPESPRSAGSDLESALPSVGARVLAFVAVLIGGACGGLIGWSLAGLQCSGNCDLAGGLGGLIGAVVAALGTAVLAVLVLRAMTEWRSLPTDALPRRYTRR